MSRLNAPLRKWQQRALHQTITHFQQGHSNFMCVAAPGAGKTRFSAAVAAELLEQNAVDFILCIAPSVSVVDGIEKTFTHTLNDPFDGKMGSKGLVITYQALQFQFNALTRLIQKYRMLIISDEIHHCAFGEGSQTNQWGGLLSSLVEFGNPLSLTLSGTPWRSNSTKIALQTYSGEPQELHTDFIYGLGDAVQDRVCRKPNLALIDNNRITILNKEGKQRYSSISAAIEAKELKYSDLLIMQNSLTQLLRYSYEELTHIRQKSPLAAGLVVASSVAQAKRITEILVRKFNQTAELVSHHDPKAHEKIRNFQHSQIDWIVSIGMISEGTDIPRLHVCAYASNVRTELFFRQVLGRILRINETWDERCTLVAFAEPTIQTFCERISEDLPEESMQVVQSDRLDIENASLPDDGKESTEQNSDKDDFGCSSQNIDDSDVTPNTSEIFSLAAELCQDSYKARILTL